MTKEEFEEKWLHNEQTLEYFEENNIQSAIWQYYKLKTTVIKALDLIPGKIENLGVFKSRDKKILRNMLSLLDEIYDGMKNFEYFSIYQLYKEERMEDIKTLANIARDEGFTMLAGSMLLCDYSILKNVPPDEVLSKYPYIDYLKNFNETELISELGLEKEKEK